MTDTHFLILLVAALAVVVLQVVVLLRKPRVELPPEWLARLQRLEQASQTTLMAVAKNEGAVAGMAQQLQGFTQATSGSLETVRQMVDDKLKQTIAETRTGRAELLTEFGTFELKLAQRLVALDAALSQSLAGFRAELTGTLGAISGALKDQLEGNGNQIRNQFTVLQDAMALQLAGLVQARSKMPSSCAPC